MRIVSARRNAWQAFLIVTCQTVFFVQTAADCGPYPINVRIGNVTLPNESDARGLNVSVGTPEQNFAFLPQWPLNNTFVYGTDGHCDLNGDNWTETGCITFRGGEYSVASSRTSTSPPANAYPIDSTYYPQMSFVADNIKLNDNHTLTNFPMGVALNEWGEFGYHPQMAFGMGPNSTILNALKSTGKIASRAYGMFWGRTGATSNTQLDGNLVFGGYDRAKVVGQPYTQFMIPDHTVCSTGLAVTITNLVLNFENGTDVSLFPDARTASMAACVVPDYPVLMTIPLDPYFDEIRQYMGANMTRRSFGIDWFAVRFDDDDTPYQGDLTITLQSGLSVRIPNDQLVVPDKHVDPQTGQWVVDPAGPTLVINDILGVNAGDICQLGRQFLSAAYLLVNQDTNQFTLWAANATADQDLVALDANGKEADSICATATATGGGTAQTSAGPSSATAATGRLASGAIAGIAVGAVAAVAIAGGVGVWLYRRRTARKAQEAAAAAAAAGLASVVATYEPKDGAGSHLYKPELPGTSGRWPTELPAQGLGTQPVVQYELVGSLPDEGRRGMI